MINTYQLLAKKLRTFNFDKFDNFRLYFLSNNFDNLHKQFNFSVSISLTSLFPCQVRLKKPGLGPEVHRSSFYVIRAELVTRRGKVGGGSRYVWFEKCICRYRCQ